MIDSARHAGLRVGLLADARQRSGFRAFLERQGVQVVLDAQPGAPLPQSWNDAQVLLVAISDSVAALQLESLMQRSPVPVVLNRGGIGRSESWGRGLLGKLEVLAGAGPHNRPELRVIPLAQSGNRSAARIVVLGGSLGGPKAVARL